MHSGVYAKDGVKILWNLETEHAAFNGLDLIYHRLQLK